MPYLLISHSRLALRNGRQVVATRDGTLYLAGPDEVSDALMAVNVGPGGAATAVRLASAAAITIDGAELGDAPIPLAHGSKIGINGARIIFGDEDATGETGKGIGITDEMAVSLDEPLPAEPTTDSGGRLVALSDGRAWEVPAEGLEIGRDPNCDLVLRSSGASRWHASVAPTLLGYVIRDASANGVYVNGRRIDEQRVLGRGDVIRIGDEEFRFDATAAKYEPSTSLRLAAVRDAATDQPSPPGGHGAPPSAGTRSSTPDTTPQNSGALTLLATLEILNTGLLHGRRFRIEHPLTHVGRGAHNEIVLGDESVSGSHATLRHRGDAWVVSDQGSTNGTYVDGERVDGERALPGACELRFGGIKTLFRPIAGAPDASDSTRGIVGVAYGGDG